jgi:hypothetical protein
MTVESFPSLPPFAAVVKFSITMTRTCCYRENAVFFLHARISYVYGGMPHKKTQIYSLPPSDFPSPPSHT